MGPPRSSKKRPQANCAHSRVKEILARTGSCRVLCPQRIGTVLRKRQIRCGQRTPQHGRFQRILLLVSSGFPRVSKRTTTAMMMSATMAIPIYSGFIKLIRPGFSGVGVGEGEAAGGGDAFFFASIDCAYCKRWTVSLSCGLI